MIVEIKGMHRLLRVLDEAIIRFDDATTRAMNDIANDLEELMKDYAPVRTGVLRDSIRALRRGKLEVVIDLIYYSLYVEFGTSKMRPQPFMRPAIEQIKAKINQIVWKHLTPLFYM